MTTDRTTTAGAGTDAVAASGSVRQPAACAPGAPGADQVQRGLEHPRDCLDSISAALLEAVPRQRAAGAEQIAATAGVGLRDALRKLSILADHGFLTEHEGGYLRALTPRSGRR